MTVDRLEIRPPRRARLVAPVVTTVWSSIAAWVTFVHGHASSIVAGVLLIGVAIVIAWRATSVHVLAHGDLLIVRNTFETKRWPKGEIDTFRLVSPSGRFGIGPDTVHVLLRDGSMAKIEATSRKARSSTDRDGLVGELNAWLRPASDGRTSPKGRRAGRTT